MTTMSQMSERFRQIKAACPGTQAEIAAKLGIKIRAVNKAFEQMRARNMVHIGERRPIYENWKTVAVYHAGPGQDVPISAQSIRKRLLKESKGCTKKRGTCASA